jgi:hypothetical protein
MTVYLWFNKYDIDEENDKVMFNVLVSKLFAFVLKRCQDLLIKKGWVHIELDGRCLWSRLCRARTQDESIPHTDSEVGQSTREEDSLVNAAASTLSLSLVEFTGRIRRDLRRKQARAGP